MFFKFIFLTCVVRVLALQRCTRIKSEDSFGKKLDAVPYLEETVTDLLQCYKNCREDGKCLSINFSTDKSLCQRLRRSHKRPSNQALKDDTGWTYLINPINPCNKEPYPCTETELCQITSMHSGGNFSCTPFLQSLPSKSENIDNLLECRLTAKSSRP